MLLATCTKLGLLVGFQLILALAANLGTVVCSRLCGVSLRRVTVFCGPAVFRLRLPFAELRVGSLPLGGYVEYDPPTFEQRPIIARWLISIAGPAFMMLVSLTCLDHHAALQHLSHAIPEIISGFLSPLTAAKELLNRFFLLALDSPRGALGVLATKTVAFNLLPLGGMAGGRLISELIAPLRKGKLGVIWWTAGLVFVLAVWIAWCIGLIASLLA